MTHGWPLRKHTFHGSFFSSITNILSYSRGWQIFMCSPLCLIVSMVSNTLWGCLKLLWGWEPNRYTTQSDCLVRKRQAIIISPKQRMCENAKSSFCFQNKHSAHFLFLLSYHNVNDATRWCFCKLNLTRTQKIPGALRIRTNKYNDCNTLVISS